MFWPNTQGGNSNVHNKEEKTDREQTSNIESVVRITSKSCRGFTHRYPLGSVFHLFFSNTLYTKFNELSRYSFLEVLQHILTGSTVTYTLRAYFLEFWGHNN